MKIIGKPKTDKSVENGDKTIDEMTHAELKSAYKSLKSKHDTILESRYCHECGKHSPVTDFYSSKKTASKVIPVCRKCLKNIAVKYDYHTKKTTESERSIREALRKADLPFVAEIYKHAMESAAIDSECKGMNASVWGKYITSLMTQKIYLR